MEINLQHEAALAELGIPLEDYPKEIKQSINSLKAMLKRHQGKVAAGDADENGAININATSARIAHDMQDFYERDFEEENQNQPTMLTGEELIRAEAVGLDANATIDQVVAKEGELAAQKARAIAVGLPDTATLQEIEIAEQGITAAADALRTRALAVGLAETASDAEVTEAENALRARAAAVGLPETATPQEIADAETAQAAATRKRQAAQNAAASGATGYLSDLLDL